MTDSYHRDTENTESLQGNELTALIIGAAIEVHKHLGPGLLESVYEKCLAFEFQQKALRYQRQLELPITYKGQQLDLGYRIDFLVNDQVVVELKSVKHLEPIHEAQLLTYLKLTKKRYGLLLNFNVPVLKQGIKRMMSDA
jgi:GxxExxY protein